MIASLVFFAALTMQDVPPVRVATYAYPGVDRAAALAPLARLVEAETGRPVTITIHGSPAELAEAVRAGREDVAMTNLAAFIAMADAEGVTPVAELDVPAVTLDGYRGVLLARRDAGIAALADLAGREAEVRHVEVMAGSTSGALVQAAAMAEAGIAREAMTRAVGGSHEAAIAALLSGEATLAGLALRPWTALQDMRPAEAAGLVEVWRSQPLPPGPVVCVQAHDMPCDAIRARLLAEDEAAAAVAATLATGWAETRGAARFTPYRPDAFAAFVR